MKEEVRKDNGGGAFPWACEGYGHTGMTLRDYFAAKAMAAILGGELAGSIKGAAEKCGESNGEFVAKTAYSIADAMLMEREK